MPNQQKYPPISFRPPEADRLWLIEHAKATGQAVNHVLVAALSAYRERHEQALKLSHPAARREPESASDIAAAIFRRANGGQQ